MLFPEFCSPSWSYVSLKTCVRINEESESSIGAPRTKNHSKVRWSIWNPRGGSYFFWGHLKYVFSALNGRWISYSEFYTDGYWSNHPRGNMSLYSKNFGMVSDWWAILLNSIGWKKLFKNSQKPKLATTIEIEHRQHETIFRIGSNHVRPLIALCSWLESELP